MNDLDNELGRTMRRHAENLSAAPLAFEDVRGKATSIRRRRQLATGLGAVAAVAVIVPTAMFASQNVLADNSTPPANSGTPTVTDSNGTDASEGPGPTMGADPHALDVTGLPTGAEPGLFLVTGQDQAMAETDEATVRWTRDGESLVVVVETESGATFGPYPSSNGLARNQAATAVAWATDDGNVMVWADGNDEPYTIQTDAGPSDVRVAAVTGTDCQQSEASDCTYYVSRYDMETEGPESFRMFWNGSVELIDSNRSFLKVQDATDDGRVVGITEQTDSGSCSALYDPAATGDGLVVKTCDHTLDAFSPNGDFVLASEPYHSGIGSGQVAIYDARTGELLADRLRSDEAMAFYNSAVWEDETHVLFSAYQDGKWSIVRMDVNGAMEFAVEPQKGDEMEVPWHFETR